MQLNYMLHKIFLFTDRIMHYYFVPSLQGYCDIQTDNNGIWLNFKVILCVIKWCSMDTELRMFFKLYFRKTANLNKMLS